MSSQEFYPPFLPDGRKHERDWWIGTRDRFGPQLSVIGGPSIDEIKAAHSNKTTVRLDLSSRTADMSHDDPDDPEPQAEVFVEEIFEYGEGVAINILVEGDNLPYVGRSRMWIWEYEVDADDRVSAGADVLVND